MTTTSYGDEKDGAKVWRHIFSASFLFFQAKSCFPILNNLNFELTGTFVTLVDVVTLDLLSIQIHMLSRPRNFSTNVAKSQTDADFIDLTWLIIH